MNDKIKMFIGNEEVVCSNEFTISEEMLSASSTILNNCYPKSWELTKDYISNFYYPEDYSKLIIGNGNYQYGDTEYSVLNTTSNNSNIQYETDVEKEWNKVEIEGNNYQDTRSGKNLWQNSNYYTQLTSANLTYVATGFNFTRNTLTGGRYVAKTIIVENGLPYTFSANITASPSNDCYLAVYRGNVYGTLVASSTTGQLTFTASADETLYFTFIINSGLQTANVRDIQVEQNATKTYYESYGVMPSADFPSEIQNVGYQNLLNLYISGSGSSSGIDYTINSDNSITLNGTATSTFYLNLDRYIGYFGKYTYGKKYTLLLKNGGNKVRLITRYDSQGIVVFQTNLGEEYATQTYYGITNENCFSYLTIANGTQVNNLRVYPMIVEGTQICPYIPFGKYGIEIKNIGKNLFDNSLIQIGKAWNNASDSARAIIIIPVKPSTNYTISFNSISNLSGVYAFGRENINDSTRTMGNYDITGTRTLTTTANTYYLGLQFNKADITEQDITNCLFQVEEGSVKSDYEKYKNNTQLYVLDEPLRAIGNVKDLFRIENNKMRILRRIKHIELAIADMNNNNDYPGWTNIAETTYLRGQYPSVNSSFEIAGIGCISNISNSGSAFALNTNGNGILFLPRSYWTATFTQTYWKTNYPDLVLKFDYVLHYPETYIRTPVEINNSYEGINNVTFNTGLSGKNTIYYYWKNFDVLFSGIVKNSGEISLNPREPHYCSLQVLDYKTFLSESNSLDFVISNKTIIEAIQMVVNAVSGYGFVVGNIGIAQGNDIIGAYSTLNQSAYDVLQYIANISGSRWRARYVDSSTMAIDFYDPDLLPQADDILYTQQYYEDNNIVNLSFSYGTRDYRNKQIVLSDEIYGDIDYRENLYADGYQTTFLLQENIGVVNSVSVNGVAKEVITKEEKDNGVDGDFWYTPGKDTLDSKKTLSVNSEIIVEYTPLIAGRQIVYNSDEVQRVATNTNTIGVIARYETRNDILSSQELNQIGQTYINYKGKAEVILTIRTKEKDLFNIGEVAYFNAPITELQQNYMVKAKNIEYIVINGTPTLFYEYQLTSSYNNEKAINYFDNQRNKAQGNIELGKSITRNIDIENETTIIWQNLTITEVSVDPTNNNILNSPLNSPFVD